MSKRKRVREEMLCHIDRWHRSGLTQREYCIRYRITRSVFYYWLKTYEDERIEQPAADTFLPVVIEDARPATDNERILVTAPNGLVTSFPNQASSIPLIRQLMIG